MNVFAMHAVPASGIDTEGLLTATTILASSLIAVLAAEGTRILIPFRRWFNAAELRSWLGEEDADRLMKVAVSDRAVEQHAILDQPTSKLMGILQQAATYVLESRNDEPLLRALANVRPSATESKDDVQIWVQGDPNDEHSLLARDRLDARIDRRLDALQARLDYRFTLRRRYSTSIVAAIVGLIVFRPTSQDDIYFALGCTVAVVLVAAVYSAFIEGLAATRTSP